MKIFDSHAHYDDDRFSDDREAVIAAVSRTNVQYICNVGSDVPSSERSVALAEKYPFIWAAAGIHPGNSLDVTERDYQTLRRLLTRPRTVALGEIGLDYHYGEGPEKEIQHAVFVRQMALAREMGKPVIIHAREAVGDCMEVVRSFPEVHGVFHCYSGSAETARELMERGWYVGFTGVITFRNARKCHEVLRSVPKERILVETDCPYLAPVPHRGERCDSRLLPHTLEAMADTLGLSVEETAQLTTENAKRLYRIEG